MLGRVESLHRLEIRLDFSVMLAAALVYNLYPSKSILDTFCIHIQAGEMLESIAEKF